MGHTDLKARKRMLDLVSLEDAGALLRGESSAEARFGWFHAVARTTLKAGEKAAVAVLSENAAIVLAISDEGARALTAPYTTRFAPAAEDTEAAYALGLQAGGFANAVLRLEALDPDEPLTAAFLAGLERSGLVTVRYDHFANWHESINGFFPYWEKRPSRLKSTVRRKSAAAEKAGVRYRLIRTDLAAAMQAYEEIRAASWKDAEPHPEFLPLMVEMLAVEGCVRMGLMELDGRVIAAQIWLLSGGRATIFKLVHREDARVSSPGTLLTWWMIKTLQAEEAITELDFGRGDDPYKRDWVSCCSRRIGVIAADCRSVRGVLALTREIIPMRTMRALRRHLAPNRSHSATSEQSMALSEASSQRYIASGEKLLGSDRK